jgi:hypothetical protein
VAGAAPRGLRKPLEAFVFPGIGYQLEETPDGDLLPLLGNAYPRRDISPSKKDLSSFKDVCIFCWLYALAEQRKTAATQFQLNRNSSVRSLNTRDGGHLLEDILLR